MYCVLHSIVNNNYYVAKLDHQEFVMAITAPLKLEQVRLALNGAYDFKYENTWGYNDPYIYERFTIDEFNKLYTNK